jgi:poly(3-hydroxybutyrate) depolymerase
MNGFGGLTGIGGGGGSTTMGTPAPSMGCGKTATLTFGTVPGEMANATPGSPNLGTGKGGWVTITSGGQARNFALRLPDNYDNTHPYRLIFGFHGNGENAASIDSGGANGYFTAYWGLQRESKNGAIFVSPEWIGGGWTQGDIAFTDDMVKTISTSYCVDMSDIVTSGFSFGGGMSHALACSRANPKTNTAGYAFRAAVLFEACSFLVNGSCPNHDPIAIWQKAGVTDGTCGFDDSKIVRNWFTDRDGCTGWKSETGNVAASTTGTVSQEPPQPPTPGRFINPGGHICTNYTGCSAGAVRWCADQAGHGNATTDGTASLFDECANVTSQFPHGNCSPGCPCTWTPDDIWTWLNDPTINKYTPNITSN